VVNIHGRVRRRSSWCHIGDRFGFGFWVW
jgi:hypothetical protein